MTTMTNRLQRMLPSRQATAFIVSFIAVLLAGWATMLDHLGPGVAAAWSAASLNAGQPMDATNAPLFRLLVQLVGAFGPEESAHVRVEWLTLVGWALLAGSLAGFLTSLFQRWNIWGDWMLGIAGGTLAAFARLPWAVALAPNPASWALGLFAAGLWLLGHDPGNARKRVNYALLGLLFFALSLQLDIRITLLGLPLIGLAIYRDYQAKVKWWLPVLLFWLPQALHFIPDLQPSFELQGYLSAAQGVPEHLTRFKLLGWSALNTMTFIPLIFAVWGTVQLVRRVNYSALILGGLFFGVLMGGFFHGSTSTMAALILSLTVMVLAAIGLGDLFGRLPKGLAPVTLLLIPLVGFLQGPLVSRQGERIWEDHLRNVVRTVRYESVILSVDEATVNAPRSYMLASQRVRPDVRLINPLRLTDPDYLEWVNGRWHDTFREAIPVFDSLLTAARAEKPEDELRPLANHFIEEWVADEVARSEKSGGVLVSPGFDPGTEYQIVPDGLLMRVWLGDKPIPFIFRQLNLKAIRYGERQTRLEQGVIAQYPMMFTNRGSWALRMRYMEEGMDWIRYALLLDPRYTPARILADEYNIHGEPLLLKPNDR